MQREDRTYLLCTGAMDSQYCTIFTLIHLLSNTHYCLFLCLAYLLAFNFILQGGLVGAEEFCVFVFFYFFSENIHCYLETTTNSQGREPRVTSLYSVPGISEKALISYQHKLVGREAWARGALNVGWELHSSQGIFPWPHLSSYYSPRNQPWVLLSPLLQRGGN